MIIPEIKWLPSRKYLENNKNVRQQIFLQNFHYSPKRSMQWTIMPEQVKNIKTIITCLHPTIASS